MKLFSIIALAVGTSATKLEWFDPSLFETSVDDATAQN